MCQDSFGTICAQEYGTICAHEHGTICAQLSRNYQLIQGVKWFMFILSIFNL